MNRRDFIRTIAGTAAILPIAARGQPQPAPVIGFLNSASPYEWAPFVAAFRSGLNEMGYAESRNLAIEFRWAFGDNKQLPVLARDLVGRRVDVIVTSGGNFAVLSAMQATTAIPIVATFGDDPIRLGIVRRLERPGGNVTGISLVAQELEAKQFQLLKELAPRATVIGVLGDTDLPVNVDTRGKAERAANKLGQQIAFLPATTETEIDTAFATLAQRGINALLVLSSAYFLGRRERFAALANRFSIAAIYPARPYVEAGGLISYGVDRQETYRQLGIYAGRVLRGADTPAEMPVQQPSKFELAINSKAAKTVGVTVPQSLIALADVVIQ